MGFDVKKDLLFEDILLRIKEILKTDSDKNVAIAIGMKPNAFYNRRKSNSIPLPEFVCLANAHNINMNWLINGEGSKYVETDSNRNEVKGEETSITHKDTTEIIIKHQGLVKRFKNPQKGLYMNERLIYIEDTSDELFDKADTYLQGLYDAATIIKRAASGNYSAPSAGSNGTMNSQRKQKLPKGAKKNGTSG